MKRFYIFAWLAVTAGFLVSTFTDRLTPPAQVGFSLAALALVYGLALWSVMSNRVPEQAKIGALRPADLSRRS